MSATSKYKLMCGEGLRWHVQPLRCHRLIDVLEVYTLEEYSDFVEVDRYIFQKIKDFFDI